MKTKQLRKRSLALLLALLSLTTTAQIDGSLNLNFNGDGKVEDLSGEGYDVVCHNDIIYTAARWNSPNGFVFRVSAYDAFGNPVNAFDNDGDYYEYAGYDEYASAIAMDGDKIVVAGFANINGQNQVAVMRLNSSGTLDTDFNGTGRKLFNPTTEDELVYDMFVDDEHRITMVGGIGNKIGLFRLEGDGQPDLSFAGPGYQSFDIGGIESTALAALRKSDNSILLTGYSKSSQQNSDLLVMHVEESGLLNSSFGGNNTGYRTFDWTPEERGLGMTMDESDILVCGYKWDNSNQDGVIVRMTENGAMDMPFANSGILFSEGMTDDVFRSFMIQEDHKIIVGGTTTLNDAGDFYLLRYDENGNIDTEFHAPGLAATGYVTTDFSSGYDDIQALAKLDDDILMAVGIVTVASGQRVGLAQYNCQLVSVFDIERKFEIAVYPMPASDYVVLRSNKPNLYVNSIDLVDMHGRLVTELVHNGIHVGSNGLRVELPPNISEGLYQMIIYSDDDSSSSSVLISR